MERPARGGRDEAGAVSAVSPPPTSVRVLVADDTATVRLLLRRALEASESFTVVGEAADGGQAVDLAGTLQPDMVLLDLSMPVLDGFEAIPRIRERAPEAQIVVLSGFPSDDMGAQVVAMGAAAFLEKQQRPDELVASLLRTWRSREVAPPTPPSHERFRLAFEHAGVALALAGPDDRLLDANAALCRLAGHYPDELRGRTVASLAHPDDRHEVEAARQAVVAGQVRAANGDIRLVRSDGRTVFASVGYAALDGEAGGQLVVHVVDVTERNRAEQELTRSNAELSSFAYLAAHELKSPLQSLAGFASLLDQLHGSEQDAQARAFVAWILDGSRRMEALVDALLTYCSVDTSEPVLAPVSLDDLLTAGLAQLEREVARRAALVEAGPLPVVTGDPVQLGQLFQNLLANALKFVPDGRSPRIRVWADREGDGWTVTVADNGIGVEEDARERIFMMFERLHPRERYPGTGIGLSICKRIIQRRGGAIWVEPDPVCGSRFRFTVPDVLSAVSSLPAA